jgi:hypothetical protein
VAETIREQLSEALSQIDRPGSFCASGSVPGVLPGLEVDGLGPIRLPLTASAAKELIKRCEQAPYGKGTQTLVDTSVRRVWRLGPDRFRLTNPGWKRFIGETVRQVQEKLGLESQKLESHLYDLLLYEPGSFFLSHRDGEKHNRMVATLVIVLPSSYQGGELVIRHEGHKRTIAFPSKGDSPFRIHYAAFYADCEHEVRPLRKGYRLCLTYNLTLARSKKSITASRVGEPIERITRLIRQWVKDEGKSAGKLVITLEHQYTQDGLSWNTLKGVDRVKANVLQEAARQAGCNAYLALLTLWESGQGEDDWGGYGYGDGRWYDDYGEDEEDEDYSEDEQDEDNGDGGEYTMVEVYETRLTADHWTDREGKELPIGKLSVSEDELLDPDTLKDVVPEEQYEGYTGNEGMTLERWYRHAAIVVWPAHRHFEVICAEDSRRAVPVLGRLATRLRQSKGKHAAELRAQGIELARTILAKWPVKARTRPDFDWSLYDEELDDRAERQPGAMLEALGALDDPGLIGVFLRDVLVEDDSVDPGPSLAPICQKYGWGTFQQELRTVMKRTTRETLERNVRLLEQICLAKPRKHEGWDELCATLAQALVPAVEEDKKRSSSDWYSREVDRAEVLAGLARALIATGQSGLLSRLVAHALASPRKYPLRDAHLPALVSLRPWLKKNLEKPDPALTHWLDACREQLESLTAKVPQEPADFRRAAPVTCKCDDCAELKAFLKDPHESVHRFPMNEHRRKHLEREIRAHKCDLNLQTERRGSPHTLVCTKNKASYLERLKTYHQDQERLATIRSIQAGLPS